MRARLLLRVVLAAAPLLVAAALAACKEPTAPLPRRDRPLDALAEAKLLDGTHLDLSKLDGKVVVINFWSPG